MVNDIVHRGSQKMITLNNTSVCIVSITWWVSKNGYWLSASTWICSIRQGNKCIDGCNKNQALSADTLHYFNRQLFYSVPIWPTVSQKWPFVCSKTIPTRGLLYFRGWWTFLYDILQVATEKYSCSKVQQTPRKDLLCDRKGIWHYEDQVALGVHRFEGKVTVCCAILSQPLPQRWSLWKRHWGQMSETASFSQTQTLRGRIAAALSAPNHTPPAPHVHDNHSGYTLKSKFIHTFTSFFWLNFHSI